MKTLLAIVAITLVIACSLESDEGGTGTGSSSQTTSSSSNIQNDKNYTVTVSNGVSCTVMIRKNKSSYSSSHEYTLQCPSGTKIGCMRVYDNSNFILGTRSGFGGSLVAADGYGVGEICRF